MRERNQETSPPYCGKPDAFVEYETAEGKWKHGENSDVTEQKTKTPLVKNKSTPSRGSPGSRQLGHDNTDLVDGFNAALSPVVAQPGRSLPHLPENEDGATGGEQNFSHTEPNHMPEDSQLHEYQYISEYSTANEHGARRKSNF